jgi:hypothetical protein
MVYMFFRITSYDLRVTALQFLNLRPFSDNVIFRKQVIINPFGLKVKGEV